ncbi:DUF1853 family protein [Microbulbifer epialgicus]|uniref:DUF1853 family protein n=1 Tax=Microbulbifer epialgicus TaxID=393907 RepID=A0ABV4P100_9GAMM
MTNFIPSAPVDNWTNLLWAVGSADIAGPAAWKGPLPRLPWLTKLRRSQLLDYFSRPVAREQLSVQLERFLDKCSKQKPTARLGVYFERLWAFAFNHHPDYRLLHHNLPLRTSDRTLGELDFVVTHLPSDSCEHWEVAVKFYLELPGPYWLGPGLRDRLDIKLERMVQHQLPLIYCPLVQPLLQGLELHIEQQWALMRGRLFRSLASLENPLVDNSRQSLEESRTDYWWADLDSFSNHFDALRHNIRWLHLSKPAWLAPLQQGYECGCSFKQLTQVLEKETVDRPLCIAALDHHGEINRGFIVPNNWYQAAMATIQKL